MQPRPSRRICAALRRGSQGPRRGSGESGTTSDHPRRPPSRLRSDPEPSSTRRWGRSCSPSTRCAASGTTPRSASASWTKYAQSLGRARTRKSLSADRGVVYQVAVRMADDIFVTAADEPTASAWLPLPWAGRPPLRATSGAATQSPITTVCQMRQSGEADDDRGSGPAPARADR